MGNKKQKNTKNNKAKNNKAKKSTIVAGKDPIAARVVFSLFIVFVILTFAVGAVAIVLTSSANAHNGFMFVGDKYYTPIGNATTGQMTNIGGVFNSNMNAVKGQSFGFIQVVNGKAMICMASASSIDGDIITTDIKDVNGNFIKVNKSSVVGVFEKNIDSAFMLNVLTSPTSFLIIFASFVAFTFILGLIYYLVSPRGAKQHDKKEEKNVAQVVTTVNSENSELLTHYLSTDDNIQPIEIGDNKTGELLNINYYNSVRLHNGEVYAVVKKYHETVRRLEEYGASDMDIIKMNMIGNNEFDELILNTHKEKTMSMWEIIDFARKLDGVYCIKKRGTLNWTYKYKSKTLFILKREDNDSDSYKVAIKVYPDAATKLNIIYKALEDSSFPIGPYWYMFNDLRNLPANVIKWLITESLNISKWQQVKADLLRDTPTLESYKLDKAYMHDMIVAGTKELDMGKFTIITQDDSIDTVKFDTALEVGFGDMNMDVFTKEISMVVPGAKNTQMSILTRKNASEALVTALCNELSEFDNAKEPTAEEQAKDMNKIATPQVATKVIKKSKKK